MKNLNIRYYVEAKDRRYIIHPNQNITLRQRKDSKRLRLQYRDINDTKKGRNPKIVENEKGELGVKICLKQKSKKRKS